MKKVLFLLCVTFLLLTGQGRAEVIDWDKIEHWSGEGSKRAALVVQFQTESESSNPGTLIWGFRWDGDQTISGEELIKEIASGSDDLVILTQFTGSMGSTMAGIGFSEDIESLLDNLEYDFDGATGDSRISFGYFEPNSSMGQTVAPGADAINLVFEAIDAARDTHVIQHPLDQQAYGYPAYDYDWWQLSTSLQKTCWNAGWYKGYWGFWIGGTDMSDMSYSGLGMTSVTVEDGDVHGWKYMIIDEDDMNNGFGQYLDDNSAWQPLNYSHSFIQSGVDSLHDSDCRESHSDGETLYFRLDGSRVREISTPGIYIVRNGEYSSKITIK